jgi:multisubunit Na+/H+ antiporter MnhE subunit
MLALLWWALSEGLQDYAVYGIVVVPLALGVSLWTAPPGAAPVQRPSGTLLFGRVLGFVTLVGWYGAQMLLGGIDVSRRLLRRHVEVAPIQIEIFTRLPEGAARLLAVAMFGLIPGSLVCGSEGRRVWLHSLHPALDSEQQWRHLEDRLARVAGLDLTSPG